MNPERSDRHILEDADYARNLIFISFGMRLFSLVIAVALAAVIRNIMEVALPPEVFYIFYGWILTVLAYLALFRTRLCKTVRSVENAHFTYYFFGISWCTCLVHYLGGVEWLGVLFYVFDVVYSNVLMRRLRGAMVTLFIMIGYTTLILLEYKGIVPHRSLFRPDEMVYDNLSRFVGVNLLIIGGYFFLMTFGTGLFSRVKQVREKRLIESRNRFETKSVQLEEITRELQKKIAENKYMKRATLGYIEKKEFELETAKKDLEDQIDKLRKTQKSMFFMIEDLNGMSAQLKDARDNLEDKVRERTDELLEISRKLHRSERLAFLGKLAGSVTHELRNPLAVLKNAAYYLDKKYAGTEDEKMLKYIDIIKKEITVIDSIIDDIMGFAKTKGPELEEADVKDVVGNAISTINVPDLVKIKKKFEDVPRIMVDSNQLMHAVMNIANNAIIAMNGNGVLTFSIKKVKDRICVEIGDTGPGIPPEQRDLIFEPLYSSKPKGTGLGLPIAKMMIENQEGQIEFDSELGEGTRFRIFLPIKRESRRR